MTMPTNPDWIEHTEKAAWDTVQALREQVQRERDRSERLMRLEPTLPRLAELLDEVREQLGLGVAPPVKLVAALVERLRAVTEERDQLREELQEQQRKAPKAHLQRPAEEASSSRSSGAPTPMRWFVKQLRRRQQERELDADLAPRGDTLAEVAAATEERLRQLAPLPYAPAAVLEAALDMGLAAMDLARAARRAQRR